jgi:hypothetical protein
VIFAVNEWSEAAIAIAGIAFLTIVISVVVWQIFATGRTGLSAKREQAYRKLAEDVAEAQLRTADELAKAVSELSQLKRQTAELERVLKAVE